MRPANNFGIVPHDGDAECGEYIYIYICTCNFDNLHMPTRGIRIRETLTRSSNDTIRATPLTRINIGTSAGDEITKLAKLKIRGKTRAGDAIRINFRMWWTDT